MRMKSRLSLGLLVGVLTLSRVFAQTSEPVISAPQQPKQPVRGPGGSEGRYHSMLRIPIPGEAHGGWIFLPSSPSPAKAPVVIFCHGWNAIRPAGYQAWINHLVSRGNIVIWPNYQDRLLEPTREALSNAVSGVKAGLEILRSNPGGVQPDLHRIAVVGHSAGGMIASGIAATAAAEGLPKMRALMAVEPGDSQRGGMASVPLADLRGLPPDIRLLILVGEEDASVGTFDGERILHESTRVPAANKALFMLHSDDHGKPALVANHYTPSAVLNPDGTYAKEPVRPGASRNTMDIGVVDAFDYLGTWRLLDQLLDAAFSPESSTQLFRDPSILSMGTWSDGVPVKGLTRLN